MTQSPLLATANLDLLPGSLASQEGLEFGLSNTPAGWRLAVLGSAAQLEAFEGQISQFGANANLLLGDCSWYNLQAVRERIPWLKPRLLGLRTSAGLGDRIGLATPGHVRAVRGTYGQVAPIFTQQSIREMMRTNRTPAQVMLDASWGVFAEGWREGFGADADHLKTPQDIDACLPFGYTFFTIDPGEHVNNQAETADPTTLIQMAATLPPEVQPAASGLSGKTLDFEGLHVSFDHLTLLKAAVKYGRAVLHVARMFEYLARSAGTRPFELEVSVDETDQPTTHAEHVYIASLLQRLGVKWVSLAPRYIGAFEKGVDYIGDVAAFEADIAGHAAIARAMGPYKLSLHSGSDKFSIYSSAMRQTRGLVHLKTAGTSYLEALRTIAALDTPFFHEIYTFARQRFETDKASYHISARLEHAPLPEDVRDWPALLDQFDAREILHVTFGSVLTHAHLYPALIAHLRAHPEDYAANLERHFTRHLSHFVNKD